MGTASSALNVGIVGCGYAAEQLHLPAIRSVPSLRVVALADSDPERVQKVGRRFGIERRYRDHQALLRDGEVEAVAVCVPPRAHAAVTLDVLDAGKHVLVEKPLCLDLDEAERLVERARRAPVSAMVGFNLRYHRHMRAARQAVRAGLVGPVELIRSVWSSQIRQQAGLPEWRRRRDTGGGALIEMAVHHVDLWRFLLGSEVDEVFASSCSETNDDQTATLCGRLRNGALAVSGFSQRATEAHEIEIHGREGRLLASPYRFDGFELSPASMFPGDLKSRAHGVLRTLRALPSMVAIARRGGSFLEAYQTEWQHFADCVRDRALPASSFDDGCRALEIVLAAIESTRIGQPVRVGRLRQRDATAELPR